MMTERAEDKLRESIEHLQQSLQFFDKAKEEHVFFSAISKNFEVCMEYAWKYLQKKITDSGIDAPSPREAIKLAGRLNLIDDVESWMNFLEERNRSVHDYLGVTPEQYPRMIQDFYREVRKLISAS